MRLYYQDNFFHHKNFAMQTKIKDFIRPQYSDPIIDMSEYFIENPQYRVIKYIPIKDGIRCWYVVVS